MINLNQYQLPKTLWLMTLSLFYIYLGGLPVCSQSGPAEVKLRLAAAANLTGVLEELVEQYISLYTHVKIEFVFGSSGNLSAQILNGAPYQLFLSADSACPDKIVASGLGLGKAMVYAYGLLCLASRHRLDETAGLHNLTDSRFKTIAIAKPQLSPYGRAAWQSLQQAKLGAVPDKVIWAVNISQAFQYVKTGAVDAGFIALSALYDSTSQDTVDESTVPLYRIQVDSALYDPIIQSLIIIKATDNHPVYPEVFSLVNFIIGKKGRKILAAAGYGLP